VKPPIRAGIVVEAVAARDALEGAELGEEGRDDRHSTEEGTRVRSQEIHGALPDASREKKTPCSKKGRRGAGPVV
jgi:hypothetical protein